MSEFSNRLFDPNNDFFSFLGDLVDVVGLSILWLFCCLPVVTIGPACTALYHTVFRGLRQRQNGRYLRFLECFRENLKQGVVVTLVCLPAGLVFYFGLPALTALALKGDQMAELLFWCWQTLAVLLGTLPLTAFPLLGRFQFATRDLLRTTLQLCIRHFPSVFLLSLCANAAVQLSFAWYAFALFLPALTALLATFLLERIFSRY
ncbi:MAG: YesL family protein [Oscillospiraceae bacterium]|jgi:uncharacterized membrane protein YesL|nr:YesL family protein [Oscillospiraceae bacterium]MCI9394851.1 YesL family protein [Oscillospiraceae bacterium]MCI9581820.1 YesL family protein [Oscillospiraceae bacterium]